MSSPVLLHHPGLSSQLYGHFFCQHPVRITEHWQLLRSLSLSRIIKFQPSFLQATRLGLLRPPVGRGRGRALSDAGPPQMLSRGRGRCRDPMGRGGALNRMVVDHRPRALSILGVTPEEKEELIAHFVVRSLWAVLVIILYHRLC